MYDVILSRRELVEGGRRIERAWKAGGVIPLTPADLARAHRRLSPWSMPRAMRCGRRNWGKNPQEVSFGVLLGFSSTGARASAGPMARVLVNGDGLEAAKAAVEAVLGALTAFSATPDPCRPRRQRRRAKGRKRRRVLCGRDHSAATSFRSADDRERRARTPR